jgi:hypothetical protein
MILYFSQNWDGFALNGQSSKKQNVVILRKYQNFGLKNYYFISNVMYMLSSLHNNIADILFLIYFHNNQTKIAFI